MEIVEIHIGKDKLDLGSNVDIKHTFQINSIAELKDRQASYTDSFDVPRTPHNIRIMEGLGIPSDTSSIPYTKTPCSLKIDGFDLLHKAFLTITDTTPTTYKCSLYSGIIEFFKEIENKTIGNDLSLTDIDHTRDLPTVISSFSNSNYRYIIGDYNGKTHYGANNLVINIDYLAPSVNAKYLWNLIHSTFGFTYTAQFVSQGYLDNLWITYPKAVQPPQTVQILDWVMGPAFIRYIAMLSTSFPVNLIPIYSREHYFSQMRDSTTLQHAFTIPQTGTYRIKISGFMKINENFIDNPLSLTNILGAKIDVFMSVNEESLPFVNRNRILVTSKTQIGWGDPVFDDYSINNEIIKTFAAGDVISFFEHNGAPWSPTNSGRFDKQYFTHKRDVKIEIERIDNTQVSFSDELSDFKITDFFKEILNMFGVTPIVDKFKKEIKYKTMAERLINQQVIDWSNKYIERTNEKYVFNSYAQENVFKHKYQDKEDDYFNGKLMVANQNLNPSATAFESALYAPSENLSPFKINGNNEMMLRVFSLYEKNVADDGTVTYKELSKRYHFVRAVEMSGLTFEIGSEIGGTQQTYSGAFPIVDYTGLQWKELITLFYPEYTDIINNARLHTIQLNLNLADVLNLDFEKLYFFSQEQQYYLLNKLEYTRKNAAGEFIRVPKRTETVVPFNPWEPMPGGGIYVSFNRISSDIGIENQADISMVFTPYDPSVDVVEIIWESSVNNSTFQRIVGEDADEITVKFEAGLNKIRAKVLLTTGEVIYSNILTYTFDYKPCKTYRVWIATKYDYTLQLSYRDCNYNLIVDDEIPTTENVDIIEKIVTAMEGTIVTNGTIEEI